MGHALIIEDAEATQLLLRTALEVHGITTTCASDGRDGLALAQALMPEIVVLDISLPGMDGWSVLEALRADPRTAGIAVIVTTAHSVEDAWIKATFRADAFVAKPFDLTELMAKVDSLLHLRASA